MRESARRRCLPRRSSRRIGFHARRIGGQMDRHFFTSLLTAVIGFVLVAALVSDASRAGEATLAGFGSSFYWAVTTVIGSGDASYVSSPGGFLVGWLLAFFGVAIVAAMTGAVVGFVIDYLLKEGQGMGAAGYRTTSSSAAGTRPPATSSRSSRATSSRPRWSCSTTPSATRPAMASTSSAATSRAPKTSSGPGSARPLRPSSSRPIARTRQTCAPSWR